MTVRDEDDELLATMRHELRAPLNAILGWVQLLRGGGLCAPEADRALEIIERNARAEVHSVDEAIDLARLASGTLTVHPEEVRWSEAVRPALAANETAARIAGVRIESDVDPELRVRVDPRRLLQITRDLVACAVRRSSRGGVVHVRVVRDGARAAFSVREHRERDGDAVGARASRPRSAPALGEQRGIGVAVARGLLRLHGGTLDEADGGATLIARLPLARAARVAAAAAV
jgi:signal transduction histidine kinase